MKQTGWRPGSWIMIFGITGMLWFLIMPGLALVLALVLAVGGWLLLRASSSRPARQLAREALLSGGALLAMVWFVGIMHGVAGSRDVMGYLSQSPIAWLQPTAGPCVCDSSMMGLTLKLLYSFTVPLLFTALINAWWHPVRRNVGATLMFAAMTAYSTAILIHKWTGGEVRWVWGISLGVCGVALVAGVVWLLRQRRRGETKEIATAILGAVAVPFLLALASWISLL